MRIDIRLELGKPIIFLIDNVATNQKVACIRGRAVFAERTRGYMRGLPKPETISERIACWEYLQSQIDKITEFEGKTNNG